MSWSASTTSSSSSAAVAAAAVVGRHRTATASPVTAFAKGWWGVRVAGGQRRSSSNETTEKVKGGVTSLSSQHAAHLVFGSNTDVGKTIVSTGLIRHCLGSSQNNTKNDSVVRYWKPLQCGLPTDEDFVGRHLSSLDRANFQSKTFLTWNLAASPHLASQQERPTLPADAAREIDHADDLLHTLLSELQSDSSKTTRSTTFIETAGGVLSPGPCWTSTTRPLAAHHTASGWSSQGDLYQGLGLPAILVGDAKLGGITTTLSSLESLLLRGYDIHSIILMEGTNVEAIREYVFNRLFALRTGSGEAPSLSILSLPSLPPPEEPLNDWYDSEPVQETFTHLSQSLQRQWEAKMDRLLELQDVGSRVIWWPFTQHATTTPTNASNPPTLIDAAVGDYFQVVQVDAEEKTMSRTNQFDACASWWTQGLGHGEPSLALAAAAAAGRYGHVIFPNVVHEPGVALSEKLLSETGPGHEWASRVFYTDNGSTAMEVALKMGLRLYQQRHGLPVDRNDVGKDPSGVTTLTVCAQADGYHGDTLATMDIAEPSVFNAKQHPWYEPRGLFLNPPTVAYQDGVLKVRYPTDEKTTISIDLDPQIDGIAALMDVSRRLQMESGGGGLYGCYYEAIMMDWDKYEALQYTLEGSKTKIASVVLEPVLQGAGGMKFIDPLWQRALVDVAKAKRVPVIYDEVAAGFYRLGVVSCREVLGQNPDVACYAKLLTGGLLPMSVTLASEEVFDTFLGDSKGEALLHGHSYTAHPVGCVTALHALDTFRKAVSSQAKDGKSHNNPMTERYFDESMVQAISRSLAVQDCMALGTVLATTLRVESGAGGYAAASVSAPVVDALRERGVYARPLGNVIYIMASPLTSRAECTRLCAALEESLATLEKKEASQEEVASSVGMS